MQDYKLFILELLARPKPPTFDELTRILLQEEDRMKNYDLDSHSSDLALIAKCKQSYRGKSWDKYRCRFQAKQKGMAQTDTYVKRNVECDYCGKPRHLTKDCFKRKNHESKQRCKRDNGNFVHKDTSISNGFKNLKLFISEAALSIETNDENAWLIDFGASAHVSCNKEWYDEYYEKINGIYIYLGDNISHKVQAYGAISVKLPDGQVK